MSKWSALFWWKIMICLGGAELRFNFKAKDMENPPVLALSLILFARMIPRVAT